MTGLKNFIVAVRTGGVQEQPEFIYVDRQVIEAGTPKEAEQIYTKEYGCWYYPAKCIGEMKDGKMVIDAGLNFC